MLVHFVYLLVWLLMETQLVSQLSLATWMETVLATGSVAALHF